VLKAKFDQEDLESTCCADVEKRIRDPGIANIAGSKNRDLLMELNFAECARRIGHFDLLRHSDEVAIESDVVAPCV
jgi:hypothetical protein